MAEQNKRSWADIASGKRPTSTAHGVTEFSLKKGKALRLRIESSKDGCNGKHCALVEDSCKQTECKSRLERLLKIVNSENVALREALEALMKDLSNLREEVFDTCKTDHFSAVEMEDSRLALVRANRKKIAPFFCECTACQLEYQQQQLSLLKEKESAAQRRLTALREFRRAYDKETLCRTSSK